VARFELTESSTSVISECRSCLGDDHATTFALKKGSTKFTLKIFDSQREGWLGEVQDSCGSRKGTFVNDCKEITGFSRVHKDILYYFFYIVIGLLGLGGTG
jgi:hypothetical protein